MCIMARVLLSLPDEFLAEVDAVAKAEKRSRSELVREALRRYIAEADVPPPGTSASRRLEASDAIGALEVIQRMRRDYQPPEEVDSDSYMRELRKRNG